MHANPSVLQAASCGDRLRLLAGNFIVKLDGFRETSLLDGGYRSGMVIQDHARLPHVSAIGPLSHFGHLRINFLVRLRYHTTRDNGVRQSSVEVRCGDTGVAAR